MLAFNYLFGLFKLGLALGSIGFSTQAIQIYSPEVFPMAESIHANAEVGTKALMAKAGTHFQPPKDATASSRARTTTGTRRGGCLGPTETAFTIFGPDASEKVLGRTTSGYPTFVWHLPETTTDFPVIFRLLAPNEANIPVAIYETTLTYSSGFVVHQLPSTLSPLSPQTEYRWQVIIECNPEFPSQALIQELSFEVVPPTTALSQTLAVATTAAEKAIIYGQEGLWYDAIAQIIQMQSIDDKQALQGLLSDLAVSMPPHQEQLRQNILEIIEVIP